jgi:hypothetical protein
MKHFSALIILFSIASMFCFSSCQKCYTCTFQGGRVEKLCPKDYPDKEATFRNQDLKNSVAAFEANGYICTQD